MYYGEIKKTDSANGIGVRVSLFVSGCTRHCKNCFNAETAELSRRHNNANVICFGEKFIAAGDAETWLDVFLKTPFDGGRHARRVGKLEPSCGVPVA